MSSITVLPMTSPAVQRIEDIFLEHYDLVYRTACVITRNPDDAEDVVQAIFVRLLTKGIPADLKDPKAYLYKTTVRASLNVLRAGRRYVLADDADVFETLKQPETFAMDDATKSELYRAVATLSPRTVEVLMLRY